MRGAYESVRATHKFFYGIYGTVHGVLRLVHGVFGIFFLIPKKSKKTNATPHFDLQVKEKNENIRTVLVFVFFRYFRILSGSKKSFRNLRE